jgi:hypothetical protein
MLPFLEHDGIEISNANRWLAYLQNGRALGLAGQGRYEIITSLVCAALDAEADPPRPSLGFSNPTTDPAPWYDPLVAASGEFLGLLVQNIKGLDGVTTRSVTPRLSGIGGGTLGPQTTNSRPLTVNGVLMATSCRGIEYGKRWLSGVLASEDQSCSVAETHMRYCCGSGPGTVPLLPSELLLPSETLLPSEATTATTDGLVIAYQSGLTSGPDEVSPDQARSGLSCEMVDVVFTLTAGNPFLYQPESVILGPASIADPETFTGCMSIYHWGFESGPILLTSVAAPSKFGKTGLVVTLHAGTGSLSGVRVFAYDDPAGATTGCVTSTTHVTSTTQTTCSGPVGALDGENPVVTRSQQFVVDSIPAGSTLVYDSAKRTVRVTLADGTVQDGIAYLDLDVAALQWIEIGEGDSGVTVGAQLLTPCGANGDATVMIATQRRER